MTTVDDVEQIRRIKYAYLRALDTRHWIDFAQKLTHDAEARYSSGSENAEGMTFRGREQIVDFLRSSLSAQVISEHCVSHPVIEVDGDEATGSWYLQDRILVPSADFMLIGGAYYDDRYRRTAEGWRISATGYSRTYQAVMSTEALNVTATVGPMVLADNSDGAG